MQFSFGILELVWFHTGGIPKWKICYRPCPRPEKRLVPRGFKSVGKNQGICWNWVPQFPCDSHVYNNLPAIALKPLKGASKTSNLTFDPLGVCCLLSLLILMKSLKVNIVFCRLIFHHCRCGEPYELHMSYMYITFHVVPLLLLNRV